MTGCTPAELVYGRKLRTRLDLIKPELPSFSSTALANEVKRKQCLQNKTAGYNNQPFTIGNTVYYKKQSLNGKYTWCKGTVIKKIGKVVYLIKDLVTSAILKKHKNQITLYKGDDYKDVVDTDLEELRGSQTSETQSLEEVSNPGTLGRAEDTSVAPRSSELVRASTPPGLPMVVPQTSSPDNVGEQEEFQEAISDSPSMEHPDEPPLQQQASEPNPTPRSKRNRPKVNYKLFFRE